MLLVWQVLLSFSSDLIEREKVRLIENSRLLTYIFLVSGLGSSIFTLFIGWLADVKLGRHKVILYGTLVSFTAYMLFFVGFFTGRAIDEAISSLATIMDCLGSACFAAAVLPFMTDQLIGATSNELSAVVYWYYWALNLGWSLAIFISCSSLSSLFLEVAVPCAACLATIIISDCLCQQWLDKTHKITNPIKLIIQVLNYARKNSYPRRRSAFTYLDEEQPSRLDFGKDKFGGPFSEEEVEDVKTVLRLLPLVACLSISVSPMWPLPNFDSFNNRYRNCVLNNGASNRIPPLLLVPLYQFILYPLFHKWVPSMLRRIGAGLFLQLVGFALCATSVIKEYAHSSNYLTCTAVNTTPGEFLEWYWKLTPLLLYGIGRAFTIVLLMEFSIAQSPDKMKGLVFGMILAFSGIGRGVVTTLDIFLPYTLCHEISVLVLLTVLFLVFLFLSKHYTLRERNREVNIQAIVEEHYERYLDQEEEYMRERHY